MGSCRKISLRVLEEERVFGGKAWFAAIAMVSLRSEFQAVEKLPLFV